MENLPGEEIPLLLPVLQRIVRLTDAHRQYGLTKSQAVVMLVLHHRESTTMSEIAQYLSSSKEQATRAVAALCDHGLVERFENAENRTLVYIRLSENGREFMKGFAQNLRTEIDARLSNSLTPGEIETLRCSLRTAAELLNKVK